VCAVRSGSPLEEDIAAARQLRATIEADEEWEQYFRGLHELRRFGAAALMAGMDLLRGDRWDQALACDLLGILCWPDEMEWGHEVAVALIALAELDIDIEVLESLVRALGRAADPVAVATLRRLRTHPNEEVRFSVAVAIPSCRTREEGEDVEPIVATLLELMEDDDSDVRDWAHLWSGHAAG
jgi:hypothetical protein